MSCRVRTRDEALYEEVHLAAYHGRKGRKRKRLFNRGRKRNIASNPSSRKSFSIRKMIRWAIRLVLLTLVIMVALFFKGMYDIKSDKATYPPTVIEPFHGEAPASGTNILILGSDQRVTQGSTEARTDTIMVMHIDATGKTKLVSFMRDTLVNLEGVSGDATSLDSKLNSAFTIGEQNDHQGAELMRQTLKRHFDIDIQYYVLIDFQTFATAIDTLFPTGVQMNAQFSTVDGQVVSSVDVPNDIGVIAGEGAYQTIAVGEQKMDGKTLLNYARFRSDDEGDSGRTRRQQEVIQAILSQSKNPLRLFTGSEALGEVYALTSTNLPLPFLLYKTFPIVLNSSQIERATIPEYGDWIDEYDRYGGLGLLIDFDKYQQRLAEMGLR